MAQEVTMRERFFSTVAGESVGGVPYFPDLSTWYIARHTPKGQSVKYKPGELISDADVDFHQSEGVLPTPAKFRGWTYLDFFRRFNWGVPVHLYHWYDIEYDGAEDVTTIKDGLKTRRWRCAEGELTSVYHRAEDGSWGNTEMPIKTMNDLDVFRSITERMRYVPRYDLIRNTLKELGQHGVLDVVIPRSPFGKLTHELMGYENLIYALFDDPDPIQEWLAFQEEYDLKLIQLAAEAPEARVIILSDHSDENLISPPQYREFCVPYYQKITEILHRSGKLVSTHLDGNFKNYMPYLKETGFDILDGCTPFPMTNWKPSELAAVAKRDSLACWCGVPSTFFCQDVKEDVIIEAGREILEAFGTEGRLILNVGDIVSPTANIDHVIKLGELVS